jgi:tetratricopeptide (TPR) repeat protein
LKRLAVILLFACTALAAEKWWDAYNRGVAAVNGGSWDLAAKSLQKAIAEQPTESTSIRAGNAIITYVPHFWLGIAKFQLGDTDGALREWRVSEEQGAVARTAYYGKMKDWVAKAERAKARAEHSAVSGPRSAAEGAISKAMQIQGDAMSAGGDRTQSYRDAQRKLQDALTQFRKAGNDTNVFASVAQAAEQAAQLFSAAAEEGKKAKAVAAARPKPVAPKPVTLPVVAQAPQEGRAEAAPYVPPPARVEDAPVISQAKVAAEVAVQELRRKTSRAEGENLRRRLDRASNDAEYDEVRLSAEKRLAELAKPPAAVVEIVPQKAAISAPASPARVDVITPAYRAYAHGDLTGAEQLLTKMIVTSPAAEAYLLRGCVRYTRAMLSRSPDALLLSANDDFKTALQRNRALRLDPRVFSPKLVARFEEVRGGR